MTYLQNLRFPAETIYWPHAAIVNEEPMSQTRSNVTRDSGAMRLNAPHGRINMLRVNGIPNIHSLAPPATSRQHSEGQPRETWTLEVSRPLNRFRAILRDGEADSSKVVAERERLTVCQRRVSTFTADALAIDWACRELSAIIGPRTVIISTENETLGKLPSREFIDPVAHKMADLLDGSGFIYRMKFKPPPVFGPDRPSAVNLSVDADSGSVVPIAQVNSLEVNRTQTENTFVPGTSNGAPIKVLQVQLDYYNARFEVILRDVSTDQSEYLMSRCEPFQQPNPPYTAFETEAFLIEWACDKLAPYLRNQVVVFNTGHKELAQLSTHPTEHCIVKRVLAKLHQTGVRFVTHYQAPHYPEYAHLAQAEFENAYDPRDYRTFRPVWAKRLDLMLGDAGSEVKPYSDLAQAERPDKQWRIMLFRPQYQFVAYLIDISSGTSVKVARKVKLFDVPRFTDPDLTTDALLIEWACDELSSYLQDTSVQIFTANPELARLPVRTFDNEVAHRVADQLEAVNYLCEMMYWPLAADGLPILTNPELRETPDYRAESARDCLLALNLRPPRARINMMRVESVSEVKTTAVTKAIPVSQPLRMILARHWDRFAVVLVEPASSGSATLFKKAKFFKQTDVTYTPFVLEALLLEWALHQTAATIGSKPVQIFTGDVLLARLPMRTFNSPVAHRVADFLDHAPFEWNMVYLPRSVPEDAPFDRQSAVEFPVSDDESEPVELDQLAQSLHRLSLRKQTQAGQITPGQVINPICSNSPGLVKRNPLRMMLSRTDDMFSVVLTEKSSEDNRVLAAKAKPFTQPDPPHSSLETEALLLNWACNVLRPLLGTRHVQVYTRQANLATLPGRFAPNAIVDQVADMIASSLFACEMIHWTDPVDSSKEEPTTRPSVQISHTLQSLQSDPVTECAACAEPVQGSIKPARETFVLTTLNTMTSLRARQVQIMNAELTKYPNPNDELHEVLSWCRVPDNLPVSNTEQEALIIEWALLELRCQIGAGHVIIVTF